VLKDAFFKLAKNDDLQSQAMIEKLLEIKELIKDREVLKYLETRLDNAPI
jgi:predicted component of type VI protein secretion system